METHWIRCEVQTDVYTGHNYINEFSLHIVK